jgi:hypothetical protein
MADISFTQLSSLATIMLCQLFTDQQFGLGCFGRFEQNQGQQHYLVGFGGTANTVCFDGR